MMPANAVLYFAPGRGHFLLQEEGVTVGRTTTEADLGFLEGEAVREIDSGDRILHFKAEPDLFVRVEAEPDCADRSGQPISLSDLVGRSVSSASAGNGVLLLVFDDGATLRCGPDPDYESWQVEGGHPSPLIVCLPGGQLSVWDETPPVPFAALRETAPEWAAVIDEMGELYNLRPKGFPPPEKTGFVSRWRRKS
jgi:hypothetical protein